MKVGDLVKDVDPVADHGATAGIVLCIDPEAIGDPEEVLVMWNDGELCNHSTCYLEVIGEES